ncbi:MAG: NPCBM/NEW2 domain-containing protein [Planctomycetota bacterium]|nr:NPCBM/NEW2 domain-containing protein [Planctomycetota bacterium]
MNDVSQFRCGRHKLGFRPLACSVLVFAVSSSTSAADAIANRYSAMLEDGTRVSAPEIAGWADPANKPSLAGKFIFHDTNPVRWILDTTQDGTTPAKSPMPTAVDDSATDALGFVEFVGGDRLPGRIAGALTGQESAWTQRAATLLIEPTVELNWPDYGTPPAVRVRTSMLRRVVWEQRSSRGLVPGTAFLRDGRAVKFRSLRWERTRVNALTEDGLKPLPYDQLAEIHLPTGDSWDGLFGQLAVLTPSGSARLMQVETANGLVATTSTERFQPAFRGDKNKADNWYQLIQPAWSLDPLYVRFRQIKTWRFFWPHQVPLSLILPSSVTHRPTFGAAWVWKTNKSVQSTPLFIGPDQTGFGWGFGVSAFHELRFALPTNATAFRTRFGLDAGVGSGGCVRPSVQVVKANDAAISVFDGKVLVGSKKVGDTGRIALVAGTKELRLIVDPVHQGRPRGADPFDIRDFFDWADPELWLDPKTVKDEIAKRVIPSVASLRGWKLSPEDQQELQIVNHWDMTDARSPRYRQVLLTASSLVRLSRQFSIPQDARWIGFSFASPPEKDVTVAKFQVRVAGEALGAFTSPPQTTTHVEPVLFPVERFRGRDVDVEVLLTTGGAKSFFNWDGVDVTAQRPGLLRLFEDEEKFVKELRDGMAKIELTQDSPYKGTSNIKMATGLRGNARLRGLRASIRERPEFGEYRYIRFYWKKQGGCH